MKDLLVVVVESPQTPENDPEKRLRTRWETGKFIDGLPEIQSLAVRVEGGAMEPQVRLIFIITCPARSLFRSVDQVVVSGIHIFERLGRPSDGGFVAIHL